RWGGPGRVEGARRVRCRLSRPWRLGRPWHLRRPWRLRRPKVPMPRPKREIRVAAVGSSHLSRGGRREPGCECHLAWGCLALCGFAGVSHQLLPGAAGEVGPSVCERPELVVGAGQGFLIQIGSVPRGGAWNAECEAAVRFK